MRLSAQDEVEAILIGLIKVHRPDVLASLVACAYRSDVILDQSPLLYAAEVGNLACLQTLLGNGFDINADPKGLYLTYDDCDECICTPLHRAVQHCHISMVAYLLQEGANPNIFDGDFCTPLHYACNASEPSIALLLLQHGANPLAEHRQYTHALGFLLHELLGHASLSDRFIQVLANHASQLTLSSQKIYALTKDKLLRIAFAMIARIGDNTNDLVGFCMQYAEGAAKAQQYQNAITAYQVVVQLDPNNTNVCDAIATCYQGLGKQRLANYRRTPSMAELISSLVKQEQTVVEAASSITDVSKTKLTK
jgi:tetratricopeptide (TPR) repeat protein